MQNAPAQPSAATPRQFGAEIDPGPLCGDIDPRHIAEMRAAVLAHGFVVLRDRRLTDDALLALARRFGAIENRVIKYSTVGPSQAQRPTLWHHHNCCDGALDDWILFYTPAVPDNGGSIEFFDAASWYTRLDTETRAWADQRKVRHDYTPVVHAGTPPVANPPWHPLVIERDCGGHRQRALYVAAHAMEFDNGPCIREPQSGTPWHRALAAAQSPGLYRLHEARAGDLILWDMKMVAHRSHPWASPSLRVIHEVMVRKICASTQP